MKMLKYKLILLVLLIGVGFGFTACESYLDKAPSDAYDDQTALVDIVDFERQVLNTYARLRSEAYYGGLQLLLPDVMGDNLILCSDGRGTYQDLWRWQFNATVTNPLWAYAYAGIKDANHVIQRLAPTNKFDGTDDEKRGKNALGAAYAMRAFFHFDLVRTYGKAYSLATASDPGVPYKENTIVDKPARESVHSNYTKIISDLEQAVALISDDYNRNANAYLTKAAVYGILARVYVTMAGNGNPTYMQKALDYASLAVAGNGSDIASRNAFASIWTGTNEIQEVMWRVAVTSSNSELIGNIYGQSAGADGYKNEYVATESYTDEVFTTDIRYTAWLSGEYFQDRPYWGIKKYRTRTGTSTANKVDAIVMRTSEMYLIIAEAQYHLGDEGAALVALDNVRRNRYSNFTSPGESGANLLTAIKRERRLELAFEGHRWHDLKRWGEGLTRDNKGDRADGSGNPSPFTTKGGNDPYWALPIPYDEILANPNLVQNQY
jgi:hypothetical protein